MLAWQLDTTFVYHPALITTLEIRFVAEGTNVTRVELEHRDLERLGSEADRVRAKFESPDGWSGVLASFAGHVQKEMDHVA